MITVVNTYARKSVGLFILSVASVQARTTMRLLSLLRGNVASSWVSRVGRSQGSILAALAAMLMLAGTAHPQTARPSGFITVGGGFNVPVDMTVDISGNVYVVDRNNGLLKQIVAVDGRVSATSTVVTLVSGLNQPWGPVVDSQGDVFFSDTNNNLVKELVAVNGVVSSASTLLTVGSGFNVPYGLAVDSNGNVFVSDAGNNTIEEIVAVNGVVSSSSTVNLVASGFCSPHSVKLDGRGNLFVADQCNHVIKEIVATNGVVSSSSPVIVVGSGFFYPTGVAVDADGNVFVADFANHSVKEILAVNGVVSSTSMVTYVGGNFYAPTGVTIDPRGNLFVADGAYNRVTENISAPWQLPTTAVGSTSGSIPAFFTFNNGGTLATAPYLVLTQGNLNGDFQPAATQDPIACIAGRYYNPGDTCTVEVTFTPTKPGQRLGAVQLMGSAGSPIAIGNLYGSGTAPIVGFGSPAQLPIGSALINPISVAFDGSGDVFVATPASSAVYEVVAVGGVVSSSSVVRTVGSGFAVPYGLAVDGSGNVFVADTGDQTVKEIVAVNGAVSSASTVSILNSSFGAPTGVAVDKSGNVFVADTSGAGAVSEIVATNGVVSSNSFVKTVGSGFSSPRHVAVDGSGNVYVADFGNNAVKEILAIDGVVSSISTVTNIGSGFSTPNDVAVAPNGSIVVADLGNNAVKEILAINGAVSPSSVVQALASGLTSPEGLAVDGSGNVIVAETDLDQVIELNVVTPPTLSFATTVVGATSTDSPQTVTITNQGNAALTFEIPTTGQNPSISANFTLDNSSTCPQLSPVSSTATLAVGSSCTEVLNFTPTIPGSISGALAIVDNSLNAAAPAYSLQTIALSGTGVLSPPAKVATSVIPSTVVSGGNLGILTAAIEDANANIISASSALVTMMITGPGGYSQTVTGTAVNGVAIFDLSSLILSAAGPYTVTTSSQGLTGTSSPVTARVGAPVAVLTNNLPATVVSGANLGTAISVIGDINGNTVTSSSAAVTTTITGPGGYSQLITRNAINGIATFDLNSLILTTAGSYTVTTTSPGLTGGSSPSTVTVGAAAKIATNNIPATIVSGGNLGIVTATIKDTNGNTVTTSSAFVTGIIAGPGGYSQTVTGTTVNGVATYDLSSPVLTVAGSYTITTNSPGLTGASSATMVTPGAPASVTSSNIPSTVVSGGNLGIVTAAIKDASGNTVTTSSAVVTGTLTGPGGYSQTVTGTAVNGIVTYDLSSLTLVTMGTYTLTSSSPGLTGATSATAVTPGAAAQVTTSNIPSTVVSGGNLGIVTATIKDANGNTVTSSSAIVTAIITGPGGYSQTLTGTAVNGVVSFDLSSLSLTQAGGYTVMTSSPGLSGTVSTATVLVGPAAKITTSNIPSIVVSGGNLGTFTATIKDANGTTVTGSPAMVTATIAGPGGYSHTVTGTAVNGVASFDLSSLSLILPGSYTITTSSPGLTGTSSAATVTVGTAATIATSNIPSTVASGGNAGIITATIKDANGNTVTKSSAVITATITGPGGYSQTVPGTAIDGVATFDLTSLHLTTSGGYTVTISSPGLTGTSAALTVPLAPDFGIAATSGSPTASLVPGAAANYTLTITPDSSGFANVISLSAMGLPSGSTYSFSPSSLTPGSTAANTVLNVQTSSTLAMIHVLGGSIGLTMALLVIPFRLPRKVRQRLRSTWLFRAAAALILLGGFAALTGCGSTNGFFGESAHSYIVTVTATSGSLSHSTTVVLNLQ